MCIPLECGFVVNAGIDIGLRLIVLFLYTVNKVVIRFYLPIKGVGRVSHLDDK